MKILQSNISGCGVPYKVGTNSEDGVYKPGTLGLLSFVKGRDLDFANVVYFHVITIRRGKGGKQRLDFNEISFPIFNTKNIMEMSKTADHMPPLDRRYYVVIEPQPLSFNHTMEMDGHDFLAWACCHAKYLSQLRRATSGFRMWPKDNKHIMNIMSAMNDYMSGNYNDEQHVDMFEKYTAGGVREDFVRKMRKISSALAQSHVTYKLKTAKLEYDAIVHVHKNAKLFGVDKKTADATLKHHTTKLEKITQLRDRQRHNKSKANVMF